MSREREFLAIMAAAAAMAVILLYVVNLYL